MTVYIIKDRRNERTEGKPSYFAGGSSTTYSLYSAQRYSNKREAERARKEWARLMDYECPDVWLSVEKHISRSGVFAIA